nr:penicillin-binding protein 1C [uncultured Carboxylicivirga sp.]
MNKGKPFYKRKGIWAIILILGLAYYWCLPQNLFNNPYSTCINSKDGELLSAHIADDGQWRFEAGDSIPYKFKQSIILFEDEYFYYHPGFNPVSMGRAFVQNIRSGSVKSGGSTISMQVIRLAFNRNRTLWNKLIETIQATRLEFRYSKDEILQMYSVHAPFGGNVVGLEAAAWRYFGRPSNQLSWAECALLAVLPNAPSLMHPGKNRSRLLDKRNRLLTKLLSKQAIDSTTYYLSLAEPLPDRPMPLPQLTPHLLNRQIQQVGQGTVNTTLDYLLQKQSNQIVNKFYQIYRHNEVHNIAAMIVDNRTKKVLSYVGNCSSESNRHGHEVDVIVAPRSTGSILKPFLYAAALDDGILLPHMLVADIPTYYSDFAPKNYTEKFDGAVPANTALSRSLNVPAVRLLDDYRVERFHGLLQKLGLTTIRKAPSHYGLSLILGGAEANLFELVSAYSSMAKTLNFYTHNNSLYQTNAFKPLVLSKEDSSNVYDLTELSPVLSAGAIYHTFEALTNVQRPEEETGWENFVSGRKVAWKTGTSFGNRDAWAIGVTPEYTIGVWVGNASGEGRPAIIGGSAAAPVMFDLYRLLPKTSWFDIPYDDLQPIELCRETGYKASFNCMQRDTLYVPLVKKDLPVCPYHKIVHLSSDEKYRVNANCYPPSQIKNESWLILPPVMAWYYQARNPGYRKLPPYLPGCKPNDESPLEIIYPKHNAQLLIPKELNGVIGRIICKASHRDRSATLFWHLDGDFLGSTKHIHQMEILPAPGKHTLSISDEKGNNQRILMNIIN